MPGSIFDWFQPTASQLRSVADRRFDDASYLLDSNQTKYANGSMYLVGFVVECRLKARLIEKRPELARHDDNADREQKRLRSLLYGHDLDSLRAALPEIQVKIDKYLSAEKAPQLTRILAEVCGTWTIFARYSPKQQTIQEARIFLEKVRELREWL